MTSFSSPREGIAKALRIIATTSLLIGLLPSYAIAASTDDDRNDKPAPAVSAAGAAVSSSTGQLSTEELKRREDWRESMSRKPLPKKGCFQSSYPDTQWQEVPCTAAPPFPMPPRRGPRPLVIGNTNDISAQAPTGFISTGIGSFDSVTGVTSVSSPIGNSGSPVANAYTLQLNTNFFNSTACAGSPNPGCRGWQQFVLYNDGTSGSVFIQYWLIRYNATCPSGVGWNQFSFTGSTDIYCYRNSSATAVPNQPITNLGQMRLTGSVSATGDSIAFANSTNVYSVTGVNAVNAAAGWTAAEFNVFGAGGNSGGGGQASFNSGSTIVPRARVFYGGTAAPNCSAVGFTGETNNLSFGPGAPGASAPGPAVFFTESSGGGAVTSCGASTSVGDTHLRAFNGLFFDFQASGDFVLAEIGAGTPVATGGGLERATLAASPIRPQAGPQFVVQARQVSGAPRWPNASVNHAVAARAGNTSVALCLDPTRIKVNGATTVLDDGQSLSLPDGVDIARSGNVYFVVGPDGDSLRAEVHDTWINASVGLGRWPTQVRGLLGSPDADVNQIAMREGTVLTTPFAFDDLYHGYADSWRVPARDSLLSVCGEKVVELGIPAKPFFAQDLNPRVYQRTRAVCAAAGVKAGPLLDACILDVAVIGEDAAAQVFVDMPAPVLEARPAPTTRDRAGLRHLIVFLLLVLLAYILWLLFKKP